MQAIAAFVMRGRNQAILSVIGFATLALFITPFGLFSAASIGLVTLVKGAKQGIVVTLIASVFMLGISSLTGQTVLGIEYVIFYWLPVWFLAQLLASKNSLSFVIMVAAMISTIAAIILAAMFMSYEEQWNKIILDNLLPILKEAQTGLSDEELKLRVLHIAKLVVNFGAAYWTLSMCASLFIARWWQSLLYHPGGFGEEYRNIRFGVSSALIGMVLVALAVSIQDGMLGVSLVGIASIAIVVFMFQGLAIAHYVAVVRKLKIVWLYLLYLAMIVLMPYELLLIALIGLSDNWANYRARIKPV